MGLNDLYHLSGYETREIRNADDPDPASVSFSFDNDVMKEAMRRLYEKKYNPLTEIDEELFNEFWDIYNQAADEGLNEAPVKLDYNDKDVDFYDELKTNNGVFAAFKTHRFTNDLAAQLIDEDGTLKSFREWERDTESIRDHHVGHWLETEYNTAVRRAHLAAEWRQFEREKDILPNLEWIETTAVTPGKDHMIFWGVIRPIDDTFWNKHRPGDRWGCKCGLRSTDKPVTPLPPGVDDPVNVPAKGIDNNPGKDAMLFSSSHPYLTAGYLAYKKLKPIVEKFVNKQLTKRVNKQLSKVKTGIDRFDGKSVKGDNFRNGEMIVLRRSLDDILFHSKEDKRVKHWLSSFNTGKLKGLKYIGWDYPKTYERSHPKYDPSNPGKQRHPEASHFLYYEMKIGGKKYYANVKMHKNYNKEVLYTIESKKPTRIRKGEPGKE